MKLTVTLSVFLTMVAVAFGDSVNATEETNVTNATNATNEDFKTMQQSGRQAPYTYPYPYPQQPYIPGHYPYPNPVPYPVPPPYPVPYNEPLPGPPGPPGNPAPPRPADYPAESPYTVPETYVPPPGNYYPPPPQHPYVPGQHPPYIYPPPPQQPYIPGQYPPPYVPGQGPVPGAPVPNPAPTPWQPPTDPVPTPPVPGPTPPVPVPTPPVPVPTPAPIPLPPQLWRFYAVLNSAQTLNRVSCVSTASGGAVATYSEATNQLCVRMNMVGISRETLARIEGPGQIGNADNQGAILYRLPLGSQKVECIAVTNADHVSWLRQGLLFINVRSVDCPQGEIRGQLLFNSARNA